VNCASFDAGALGRSRENGHFGHLGSISAVDNDANSGHARAAIDVRFKADSPETGQVDQSVHGSANATDELGGHLPVQRLLIEFHLKTEIDELTALFHQIVLSLPLARFFQSVQHGSAQVAFDVIARPVPYLIDPHLANGARCVRLQPPEQAALAEAEFVEIPFTA